MFYVLTSLYYTVWHLMQQWNRRQCRKWSRSCGRVWTTMGRLRLSRVTGAALQQRSVGEPPKEVGDTTSSKLCSLRAEQRQSRPGHKDGEAEPGRQHATQWEPGHRRCHARFADVQEHAAVWRRGVYGQDHLRPEDKGQPSGHTPAGMVRLKHNKSEDYNLGT